MLNTSISLLAYYRNLIFMALGHFYRNSVCFYGTCGKKSYMYIYFFKYRIAEKQRAPIGLRISVTDVFGSWMLYLCPATHYTRVLSIRWRCKQETVSSAQRKLTFNLFWMLIFKKVYSCSVGGVYNSESEFERCIVYRVLDELLVSIICGEMKNEEEKPGQQVTRVGYCEEGVFSRFTIYVPIQFV